MSFEEIMTKYGLPVVCMSLIVMILVGLIKIFTKVIPTKKAQEKGESSKLTKIMSYLYLVITLVLSIGVTCAYVKIFNLEFSFIVIFKYSCSVFGCSQALYPIYRDYGGRFLLQKFIGLFKGKNKEIDDIIEVIEKTLVLTDTQKEKIKDDLAK